jgi:ubiquitin-conjugating enzyme E2 Z
MSSISIKRITRDVMNIKKDPMNDIGIFIHWDEEDLHKVKALIIGPEDTPYAYGNYLFDITFSDEYPHKPPQVKYQTRYGNIRFNPNLYTCGKVCVSILNTWSGPQWTSCQSLRSVLLSLQSLLNENPLHNEPGFENENGDRCHKYNQILTHSNFNIAILNVIKNPGNFDVFLPEMRDMFIKNYSKIIKNLEKYKNKNNQKISSPVYNMNITTNYKKIIEETELLYIEFTKHSQKIINDVNIEKEVKDIAEEKEAIIIKKSKKRIPNQNPENYDINETIISENDGKKYFISENKKGKKLWKRYLEEEKKEIMEI